MSSTDIAAYIVGEYNLCACCAGRTIGCNDGNPHSYIEIIGLASGFNVYDESSYDSREWPKVLFDSQVKDDDRCTACGDFLAWFGSYQRRSQTH